MIYFFHGNNAFSAKSKISKLKEALLSKKPDALYLSFDDRNLDIEFIKSLFGSVGLFEEHHIIFIDRSFSLIGEFLDEMKDSSHVFILFEDKEVKDISKRSEKIEEHSSKAKVVKEFSKIFILTDAIGKRDKKRSWSTYQELLLSGMSPDEILPMIFWQIKGMLAVSYSKNKEGSGLKPFVYSKSKKYSENYSKEELKEISRKLVNVLYGARKGKDMSVGLERMILSI